MADTKSMVAVRFVRDKIIAASTSAGSKVYISAAPQSVAYPYVVVEIISRGESPTQDSGSAVDVYRVQVDCWAKSGSSTSGFSTVSTLAEAVRTALSRQTDYATYDYDIDGVQEVNLITDYIPEIEVYRETNDYLIRIK